MAKFKPAFQRRAPFDESEVSSRSFSFATYIWWRLAAESLPENRQRKAFSRRLGDSLVERLYARDKKLGELADAPGLAGIRKELDATLGTFIKAGLIREVKVEQEDDAAEDFLEGYAVDTKITLKGKSLL